MSHPESERRRAGQRRKKMRTPDGRMKPRVMIVYKYRKHTACLCFTVILFTFSWILNVHD